MSKIDIPNAISDIQLRKLTKVYSDFFENLPPIISDDRKKTGGNSSSGHPSSAINSAGHHSSSVSNRPAAQPAGSVNSLSSSGAGGSLAGANAKNAGLSSTGAAAVSQENLPTATASTSGQTETEKAAEAPKEDPMETLDKLIGLESIKKDVKELIAFVKIQKARKDAGLKSVPVSLHLVFTGNPGTGKTTVARIIASLYKDIGVLSKGQLVEVDRSGLVAGYVGQTAIKTQEQINKAMGGVLFIDEAYSLSQKEDAFGQEAIETILKAMEDHRDDLVVIVAGYTEPMEDFINSNPGLKSRFNKYIEFPDYSMDELMGIFEMNCKKYDYTTDEDTLRHVREFLSARKLAQAENFANARDVRNLFEEIITNQAVRISGMKDPSHEDMMKICMEDLDDVSMAKGQDKNDPLAAFMQQLVEAENAKKEDAASGEADNTKKEDAASGEAVNNQSNPAAPSSADPDPASIAAKADKDPDSEDTDKSTDKACDGETSGADEAAKSQAES